MKYSLKNAESVQYIKGVGPKRAEILNKIGIKKIEDILLYFPKIWQDRRPGKNIESPFFQNIDVFLGEIKDSSEVYTATGLRIFKVIIENENIRIEGNIFKKHNRKFDVFSSIKRDFIPGNKIWVVGKIENDFFAPRMRIDEYYLFSDREAPKKHINRIIPIYSLTEGISQKMMREIVFNALNSKWNILNPIPYNLEIKRNLIPKEKAILKIHFPDTEMELNEARRRLVYEELFLMAIAREIKKRQTKRINKGFTYQIKKNLLTPFKQNMGFEFTPSQKKAINDIFADMLKPYPMSRLLQGDVGSGKTVVALSACLLAAENNKQSAFMAPTEILAEQHYQTFKKFLANIKVNFELLTSGISQKKKKEIIEKTQKGEIDILIGTHSLIENTIKFKDLSLIIIDEQHRFGVRQRALLKNKGKAVDMLVMTATPIPRTLFLAMYGDLDLSTLTDMPEGRKPVKTIHSSEEKAFEKAKEVLYKGLKAYIVYPVIEENNNDIKSVKKEYEKIKTIFNDFPVYMLHGKMKAQEKQKIMEDFSKPGPSVLVCTQIIEVGIDIPQACIIIIQHAEKFGLADLHQLRGRVGRGERESYCYLISDKAGEEAIERINAMCSTNNGFELSEKDAYLRGTGEIMGTKQHGEIEFKIASINMDKKILEEVIIDKDEILDNDPMLLKKENQELKKELFNLYGKSWNIIDLT